MKNELWAINVHSNWGTGTVATFYRSNQGQYNERCYAVITSSSARRLDTILTNKNDCCEILITQHTVTVEWHRGGV